MPELAINPLWFVPLMPLAFLIIFPLFWCFVIWLISLIGGWHRLAARYRTTQPPSGKKWFNQYGYVGSARYGNLLNIATNDEGIFLETMPLFRIGHPRLFIPWRELHNPTPAVYRRGRRPLVQVEVGTPAETTLSLPPAIFEESAGYTLFTSTH